MALSDCLEKIRFEQDIADYMLDRSNELLDGGMDQLSADRQVIAEMVQDIESTLLQIESQLKINRDGSKKQEKPDIERLNEIFDNKSKEVPQEKPARAESEPKQELSKEEVPITVPKEEIPIEVKAETPEVKPVAEPPKAEVAPVKETPKPKDDIDQINEILEKKPDEPQKSPHSPIQQKQIDKINKEYTELIGKKQDAIVQVEKDMREALLEADKRNGLFGDTKPVEKDEIIKRDEQGFSYNEATRAAVRKKFEENIAELRKEIVELSLEQKGKIESIINQQDLFAMPLNQEDKPAPIEPQDKESVPKLEDFGKKVGGARKDLGITRTVRDTDSLPAWRRKYSYANADGTVIIGKEVDTSVPFVVQWAKEIPTWAGKRTRYSIVTAIDSREPKIFNSEEEAEAYIPIYEVWKQNFRVRKSGDNYVITKTSSTGKVIEYATFPTEEDANVYLYSTEGATSLLNHKREDFSIPALEKVERTGKDWRKGRDISTEEFMNTFGFRGGEFGNWVKPEERRVMLNAAYDSFMDLAEFLNITPRALSFGGELSIAFGARGRMGAAAHFEPERAVINLTRMNGAGSLAHEWAHALDNYFGLQASKKDYARNEEGEVKAGRVMRTEASIFTQGMRKEISDLFDAIVEATQQKSVTRTMGIDEKQKNYDKLKDRLQNEADSLIKKFENGVRRYQYNRKTKQREDVVVKATPEQVRNAKVITDKILAGEGERPKWSHIPESKGHLEFSYISPETLALDKLYKEVFGRSGLKRDGDGFYNLGYFADKMYPAKETLDKANAGESETLKVPTDYLKASKVFDKSRAMPYWSTKVEMFARAFEYFIETKLLDQNVRADYLQYDKAPVYEAVYGKHPYPIAEERTELNKLFQEFFNKVKVRTDENNVSLLYETNEEYIQGNLDGFESEKQKQDAIDKAVKTTESQRLNSGRGTGIPLYPKIKPRTVLEGFKESGYIDFIGQKITSPQDVADLWSIHRSPNIEKAHAIFVKDGVIVGTTATTLNRNGMSLFPLPAVILELYNKFGADGVYYLHNHPSGYNKPSAGDIIMTANHHKIIGSEVNILGHIIIDNDKLSVIDVKERPVDLENVKYTSDLEPYIQNDVKEYSYKNPVPKLFSEREKIPSEIAQVRMIEIAKALLTANDYKGAIIYMSSDLSIAAYDVFPEGATEDDIIGIAKDGIENNMGRSVIFVQNGHHKLQMRELPAETLDLIDAEKNEGLWYHSEREAPVKKEDLINLWEEQNEYRFNKAIYQNPSIPGENIIEESQNTYNKPPIIPPTFVGEYLDQLPDTGPRPDLLKSAAEIYKEKEAKRTIPETVRGIREYIQDLNMPVRRFEEEVLKRGGKQDNNSKPYRDSSLAFGRQEKLYNDYFETMMKPILQSVSNIKRTGVPGEEILPYIISKHAKERNAVFRGRELREWVDSNQDATPDEIDAKRDELKDKDYSGVMPFDTTGKYTNPDALAWDIITEFESKVDKKLIDDLWNNVRSATTSILDTWEKGNQISPSQKKEYLDQFQFFVPLRGWREGAAKELIYTKGEGFSRSMQHAEGRRSLADNPLAYLLNVEFQAISEQIDNEVKTSMLNLIIKNLGNNEIHELATIKKLYYLKVHLPDGSYEWEATINRPAPELFESGDARTKIYREHERLRKPIQAREHEVIVHKPGGDMVIVFKGKNLSTGQALNKQNYMYRTVFGNIYDARDINKVMALMGHLNNMLKAAYTSWNVVFPFTNFMRDFQEASITQHIKGGIGLKVITGYKGAFPAVVRRLLGHPNMNNQTDRDLEDFYNFGGATGYTHTKTIEDIERDINKAIKRMVSEGTLTGSMASIGHNIISGIEHWNRIFEDATRFSVYMASLSAGNTKEDAASDAKEASVNFNRKGKGSKAWDAWFAFFNVAIQSMQKNFKLAKDFPAKFTAVATSFIMLGFLEAVMNALTKGDDDDDSYYNINPYMRQNYLIIPNIPKLIATGEKGNKYLSIPLPQFWRGFKSMGAIAFDIATGKMKVKEGVMDAIGNFGSSLLPVDVGGFYKSGEFSFAPIVPTILKPIAEILENKNYMGYSIKNEPFTKAQEKSMANAGLGKNNVSPAAKFFTDMLFRWGGGKGKYKYYYDAEQGRSRKVPGLMDINPSTIEHLFKGYTGGSGGVLSDLITSTAQAVDPETDIDFKNVPFVNRFLRKTPEAMWNIRKEYYDLRDQNLINTNVQKEAVTRAEESDDWSEVTAIMGNEYMQKYRQVFQNYEKELDDAANDREYDPIAGSKRSVETMQRAIDDIKDLKKQYNIK